VTRDGAAWSTTAQSVSRDAPDPATRVVLVLLSRLLDWRPLLTVVQPDTLVRWHRQGWRLLWRWKSQPVRPPIPADVQRLIVSMAQANPIHDRDSIYAAAVDDAVTAMALDGGEDAGAIPAGECVLRAADRHDSARVPGWADPAE
jgi:hypothetical protein